MSKATKKYKLITEISVIVIFIISIIIYPGTMKAISEVNISAADCDYIDSELLNCERCDHAEEMRAELASPKTEPQVISRTYPVIPPATDIFPGTVVIEVTVLPDSTIGYLEVKESVPEMDSLALETVEQWEFIPAYRNGEATLGFVTVEIVFQDDGFIDETDMIAAEKEEFFALRSQIDRLLRDTREIEKHKLLRLPLSLYSENYHTYSPSRNMPLMRRNRFSLIPGYTSAAHLFQNEFPFFQYDLEPHRWEFATDIRYRLPVTLIDAYLGLGYLDMDYGHINLSKNDAIGISDLQLNAGFIMEDGYWLGSYEKKNNFMVDLYYPFDDYSLRWNLLAVRQQIPAVKLRFIDISDPSDLEIEEDIDDQSLYFSNPFLDMGVRYEEVSYKYNDSQAERKLWHFNLNRSFVYKDHLLHLGWETIRAKEYNFLSAPFLMSDNEYIYNVGYDFDTKLMYLRANFMSGLGYNYHATSEASYKFGKNFHWGIGYMESDKDDVTDYLSTLSLTGPGDGYFDQFTERDIYTKVAVNSNAGSRSLKPQFTAYFGKQHISQLSYIFSDSTPEDRNTVTGPIGASHQEVDSYYVKADYSLGKSFRNVFWSFYGFSEYYLDKGELWYLPCLFTRNVLEGTYQLPHNNAITIGLVHSYFDDYEPVTNYATETSMLDAFLRISITNLFDIQADVLNILESETIFGQVNRAGVHINMGIRWLFFN